jgi:8-amino-7-oxononanoate synthase
MPSSSKLTDRMHSRIAELESNFQLREPKSLSGVNLCSNDYLGLAADARLKAALKQAVGQCERVCGTGSRLLSGHDAQWDQLEEEFAAFAGTESSLFFSSGFAANTGLLSALLGEDDVVFSDQLNHASIIDGIRLSQARKVIYPHADMNALEDALRLHSNRAGVRFIVTESIFSMDGDRAPLAEIFRLASRYGAEVIVDEAHAVGTCGPLGSGLVAEIGGDALAVVHTCGKALAGVGAFVCGSKTLRQFLINHARSFVFSTALPPYFALQIGAALRLARSMEIERKHLAALAERLRSGLSQLGHDVGASGSQIVPLVVGSNESVLHLAGGLQTRGFAVRAVRPPSVPVGTARLRLSLTASLNMSDLERFIAALSSMPELVAHA